MASRSTKKTASKNAAHKRAERKHTAPKKTDKKTTARKTKAVNKKAPSKKAASKKAASKKAASKKTPSKKTPSKKTPSKKTPSRKTPSKKTPSKKTPSRKTPSRKATNPTAVGTKSPRSQAVARSTSENEAGQKTPTRERTARKANQQVKLREAGPASATDTVLDIGDTMPVFTLSDHNGETFDSSSLFGQAYVLYFYPRDDTPGCTKEACGFRDELSAFRDSGVQVIGVSPDKPESHTRFVEKYGLNFPLLADTDKTLASSLGVWQLKKNYGREYMGIVRSTFLVGKDGSIQRAWRGVRVAGHIPEVLEAAREL